MSQVTYEQVLSQVKALPPDDLAKLREYLDAQDRQDDGVEVARLRARDCAKRGLTAEYQWIDEHRDEFAGRWVALKGSQLISHGPRGREVLEAARKAGHPDAFLKLIVSAEESTYTVF